MQDEITAEILLALLDVVPGYISWVSKEGLTYIGCNRKLANIWGLEPEEVIGKSVGSLSEYQQVEPILEEFFTSPKREISKIVMSNAPRGQRRYFMLNIRKLQGGDTALIISQDITSQRLVQERLNQVNKRFAILLDVVAQVLDSPTTDGRLTKWLSQEIKGNIAQVDIEKIKSEAIASEKMLGLEATVTKLYSAVLNGNGLVINFERLKGDFMLLQDNYRDLEKILGQMATDLLNTKEELKEFRAKHYLIEALQMKLESVNATLAKQEELNKLERPLRVATAFLGSIVGVSWRFCREHPQLTFFLLLSLSGAIGLKFLFLDKLFEVLRPFLGL